LLEFPTVLVPVLPFVTIVLLLVDVTGDFSSEIVAGTMPAV